MTKFPDTEPQAVEPGKGLAVSAGSACDACSAMNEHGADELNIELLECNLDNSKEFLDATASADLLVVTKFAGRKLPRFARDLDTQLDGRISKAIADSDFKAHPGRYLLVQTGPKTPDVLLVGLGEPTDFGSFSLCGLVRLVLEKAHNLKASHVVLAEHPHRLTERSLNLRLTGQIIRCRAQQSQFAGLTNLKKLTIACAPQAARHLEKGLLIETQRCQPCQNPRLS